MVGTFSFRNQVCVWEWWLKHEIVALRRLQQCLSPGLDWAACGSVSELGLKWHGGTHL